MYQQSFHQSSLQQQHSSHNRTPQTVLGMQSLHSSMPQPTVLRSHQQASRQVTGIYNNANDYLVSQTNDPMLLQDEKKSHSRKDEQDEVLRAVYEKRINQGAIIQTRPATQSSQHIHVPLPPQQTSTTHLPPVRIVTPQEMQMRAELSHFQKQSSNMSSAKHAAQQQRTERPVTGKASIKNLIKISTARS